MDVGLTLVGRLPDADGRLTLSAARRWLARAAVWFEADADAVLDARLVRDGKNRPRLLVSFHPAAEDVEVRLTPTGRVTVSAATTPCGPGYHAYLCDVLREFAAAFGFAWHDPQPDGSGDETGYFHAGDRAALEREFLAWLGAVCRQVAELLDGGASGIGIGMLPDHGIVHPGPVLTPLGPRSVEWVRRTAADPASGFGFFPWWEPGLDALFFRGRGLARLWTDFPFRPPLTEAEGEMTDQIAADLATAYQLDSALDYPWPEWAEVIAAVEADAGRHTVEPISPAMQGDVLRRAATVSSDRPPVGYRRFPVRVPLPGGWSVEVPGSFAREWDDDGLAWTAWDAVRSVSVSAAGFMKPGGVTPTVVEELALTHAGLPDGDEIPGPAGAGFAGEATFGPHAEDGRRVWRLTGFAAVPGQIATLHVVVERAVDREWAEGVWRSLRFGRRG